MTAIAIDDLPVRVSGGGTQTLSLRVEPGESVALVGEDQRWLTPIIRQCGGLDPVESGSVHVGDVDVGRADHRSLLRLRSHVGYISVSGGLFANLSLLANVALPLHYRGVAPEEADARAAQMLARAGLSELASSRAATVSMELQKVVAYVRALALEPQVLLVEDPAAHLHPQGREVVESLHAELRARRATVLIADDDRDLAGRLATRVVDVDRAGEAA